MEEKKLNQIEQSNEIANENNNTEKELWEALQSKYPKIELSTPDENSPKIRTYEVNNSYFADKGCCRSEGSRTYSVQDLVTIETSWYCSPDGRDYGRWIDKINLFPTEEDIPQEYDNTTSNKYGSGQYDYLSYDKENKRIWSYSVYSSSSSWSEHYFWVSPDSTILFPWMETVQECNGWYFHHIIINEKSGYRYVDRNSIQDSINALIDQKKEKEKVEEYRKNDLWVELYWTEHIVNAYGVYNIYIWNKHGEPAHKGGQEIWNTNKILVKFWNPWDCIVFYWWWTTYCVHVNNDKWISITHNMDEYWWNDKLKIHSWQIFINWEDVYNSTINRVQEKKNEQKLFLDELDRKCKENWKLRFNALKDILINTNSFTESEFKSICKYAWKWKILGFLGVVESMMISGNIKKEEILSTMKDIEYPGNTIFWNYILIKRKAKKFRDYDVKRVIDKWYA